ncbi:hypothetical protein Tcan_17582 [Toxocara canis]|uniref:Uncharacterized protein n=1 Tax=Toxocara canis TaxID=6265 RepID=A0A0B2W084_TOXCA|nr:hypothetical protein Tcan_17582 [Toxocara canis]
MTPAKTIQSKGNEFHVNNVIFIRRGRKFVDTLQIGRNNSTSTRFPFWKLSLNVLIFAVVNFAFVYATFMTVFFQDSCYWRVNRDRRTKTIGLLRCALLARIIIDAIVGFVIDPQLRRVAANMFGFWRCVSTVKRKLTLSAISAGSSSATTDSRKDFPAARIKSISLTVSSQ